MRAMQITDGQKFALIKLMGRFAKNRNARLWMLSKLLNKTVESTSELSVDDWRKIRDMAYPDWSDDNWYPCEEFFELGYKLYREYEEDVVGQMSLFGKKDETEGKSM